MVGRNVREIPEWKLLSPWSCLDNLVLLNLLGSRLIELIDRG